MCVCVCVCVCIYIYIYVSHQVMLISETLLTRVIHLYNQPFKAGLLESIQCLHRTD